MMRAIIVILALVAAPPNVARIDVQDNGSKSLGTGTLISPTLIITNWHVVKDRVGKIQAIFPDRICIATVIKTDKTWDLAALRIEPITLPFVALGDSPKIGDVVTVGGYGGGGYGGSGKYRSDRGKVLGFYSPTASTPSNFFQVDAQVRSGDSGGPILVDGQLVDMKLVGVLFGGRADGTYGVNVTQVRMFLEDIVKEEFYDIW